MEWLFIILIYLVVLIGFIVFGIKGAVEYPEDFEDDDIPGGLQ